MFFSGMFLQFLVNIIIRMDASKIVTALQQKYIRKHANRFELGQQKRKLWETHVLRDFEKKNL